MIPKWCQKLIFFLNIQIVIKTLFFVPSLRGEMSVVRIKMFLQTKYGFLYFWVMKINLLSTTWGFRISRKWGAYHEPSRGRKIRIGVQKKMNRFVPVLRERVILDMLKHKYCYLRVVSRACEATNVRKSIPKSCKPSLRGHQCSKINT